MELIFRKEENQEEEVLFVPTLKDDKAITNLIKSFDYEDEKDVLARVKKENFKGNKGQVFVIHDDKQVLVFIGTGQAKKLTTEDFRKTAGHIIAYLKKYKANKIGLISKHWLKGSSDISLLAQSLAEGIYLANYNFDKYKKTDKEAIKVDIKELYVYLLASQKVKFTKAWELGKSLAEGTILARDLVNEPAGTMTPQFLADTAREIAKTNKNITVKILEEDKIAKLKMDAFLSIAKGSHEAPKFIHLIYKPIGKAKDKIAIVGKGITFDSGGLNIKPWEGMYDMKVDMAGAATVLGVFEALAVSNPKVEVHGIIAACENMPSGNAVKPGDIVKNMQGKSIEIAHTDAEGRVTLADSLAYAQKQGINKIVDLATLTGSVVVALGSQYAGFFANNNKLAKDILKQAESSGETMWQLPLAPEYKEMNKSKVADIRNISNTKGGGSIMAAWFLDYFIEEGVEWAHIDIAGPAYIEKSINSYTPVGGAGFGVRTILNWLRNI
ncbi:MAG: leucyl aminopeptidase [Candidatus Komeilibacteria bacterium]|jgi:leucyl aminopeptidase|nr:leucyl aminopeptidase [Candidatus Komeilibacteria bacterium]MBT4447245.1 leucyl aminopeptidase [Candidatus Komeilibacteria bacterium]